MIPLTHHPLLDALENGPVSAAEFTTTLIIDPAYEGHPAVGNCMGIPRGVSGLTRTHTRGRPVPMLVGMGISHGYDNVDLGYDPRQVIPTGTTGISYITAATMTAMTMQSSRRRCRCHAAERARARAGCRRGPGRGEGEVGPGQGCTAVTTIAETTRLSCHRRHRHVAGRARARAG